MLYFILFNELIKLLRQKPISECVPCFSEFLNRSCVSLHHPDLVFKLKTNCHTINIIIWKWRVVLNYASFLFFMYNSQIHRQSCVWKERAGFLLGPTIVVILTDLFTWQMLRYSHMHLVQILQTESAQPTSQAWQLIFPYIATQILQVRN